MIRLYVTLCLCLSFSAKGQYYYKDIVTSSQTVAQLKQYKQQGVKQIKLTSFESTGDQTQDFAGEQQISDNYTRIETAFNTALTGSSKLTTFFDGQGRITKTVDTTDGSKSVSGYRYNTNGLLSSIINISTSAGQRQEKEEHAWTYDPQGKPVVMKRIKNDVDTSIFTFVLDENGNVAEENSVTGNSASYYYYYDTANRLTDIVTYNRKAKRLLPVYIFEYNEDGRPTSMMVIPEGSDDYQKWHYQYNTGGLKTKETAYNKRRQLLGRIEYSYTK